jgi:hypothetical protein
MEMQLEFELERGLSDDKRCREVSHPVQGSQFCHHSEERLEERLSNATHT